MYGLRHVPDLFERLLYLWLKAVVKVGFKNQKKGIWFQDLN